jgi:hypothetical protein|tara:strand:- start:613 stop:1185 length:573 start_codon:yes stop_codon:yes gene_type:complete
MVDWTITDLSNVMDKSIGYVCVLAEMRQFVQNNAVGHLDINIHQTAGAATLTTTLRMSADNFTITAINGHGIHYNYGNLPTFFGWDLPASFPTGGNAATDEQKAKLIHLLSEAARSTVIEEAFLAEIPGGGGVVLRDYGPLVNQYGHTCAAVGLLAATPARPLTAADYLQYAATLANDTPVKIAINALFG